MNKHAAKIFFAILMGVSLLMGNVCAADKDILAQVGNKTITAGDLDAIISLYPENQQAQIKSNPENRDAILKNLVTIMVISDIARKKGYEKKRDIKKQLQLMRDEYLTKLYIEKDILAQVKVSDREAEDYYKNNRSLFEKPEQVRVRHILIGVKQGASEEEKKAAWKKAEDLLERIKKGEDFAKLAGEFSDDGLSKQKGGDIGFIARGVTVPAFDKIAFALEPGTVSGIVETPSGYHLIKVEEKKKAEIPPYESIKDDVKARALQVAKQAKVNGFIETSLKNAGVKFSPPPPGKKK